jgi:hypothetical protein
VNELIDSFQFKSYFLALGAKTSGYLGYCGYCIVVLLP